MIPTLILILSKTSIKNNFLLKIAQNKLIKYG